MPWALHSSLKLSVVSDFIANSIRWSILQVSFHGIGKSRFRSLLAPESYLCSESLVLPMF